MASDNEDQDLRAELTQALVEIERLKQSSKTTLSGTEFITLIFVFPVIIAFVTLGIIIVWKATSSPETVAPHLDIVLVAMGLFSGPVTAFIATLAQRLVTEKKGAE